MMGFRELLDEVERLPATERWQLVKYLLQTLEHEQQSAPTKTDWHTFLRETYGALRDTPIERWDEGEYEDREPLT